MVKWHAFKSILKTHFYSLGSATEVILNVLQVNGIIFFSFSFNFFLYFTYFIYLLSFFTSISFFFFSFSTHGFNVIRSQIHELKVLWLYSI